MAVEIRHHQPGDVSLFMEAGRKVMAGAPGYIAPLAMEVKDRLTPGKNPFWEHGEGVLMTAWKDGELVGRISAQIDHEHQRRYQDDVGFFGFFDTIDDQEVASALLDAAHHWLAQRGMKSMRGPLSLNMNEETGLLIDGFDEPPALMMGHAREYQQRLAEGAGLEKAKDLLAWKYLTEEPPKRAQRAWEQMQADPTVRFRSVNTKDMRRELDMILEIFNDAWSENWGFVPATEAEVAKMAEDMKLLIDPNIAFFAEINGVPAGMVVALPNITEAIRDIDGKLFPFGWAKLVYRLKWQRLKSARLMLLGIKKEFRGVKRYGALSTAMYAELAHRGTAAGYEWAELGWTLEDNRPINLGIKAMRAKVYKTYRVYERPIEG